EDGIRDATVTGVQTCALPILIGVGGVFSAEDAWEKICAGASLIQLYTGFIYEGPGVAARINEGLADIMKREGFGSLDDAVGCREIGRASCREGCRYGGDEDEE